MKPTNPQTSVAKYYSRLGSRLGYKFVMKKSQHFGYYDDSHTTEDTAQQKYHETFAKLLDLQPGMKVLDAGCGQGVVATYLAKHHGVDVTGITVVPYEVDSAQQTAARAGVSDRAHFQLADYADPPFEPESFDRIYTTETLSHAVDVNVVLRAFMKLLKPGGKLVCAEYEFDFDNFDLDAYADARFVQDNAAIHGIFQFDLGEFSANLKAAGFTAITEEDWTKAIAPSFRRLARLGKPFVGIVKAWALEKHFINTVASQMYFNSQQRGLMFYKVYSAKKK